MPEPETPYQPLSCSFHDRLEHWAIRRVPVDFIWVEGDDERIATARIVDVFASDGADHLRLDSGTTIRLDRLISVHGVPLPAAC